MDIKDYIDAALKYVESARNAADTIRNLRAVNLYGGLKGRCGEIKEAADNPEYDAHKVRETVRLAQMRLNSIEVQLPDYEPFNREIKQHLQAIIDALESELRPGPPPDKAN